MRPGEYQPANKMNFEHFFSCHSKEHRVQKRDRELSKESVTTCLRTCVVSKKIAVSSPRVLIFKRAVSIRRTIFFSSSESIIIFHTIIIFFSHHFLES